MGGRTAGFDTNLRLVESWSPGSATWERLRNVPGARGGTGLAAIRGSLVSVGGEETRGTIASVFALDARSGRWRRLPDLPTPRHGLAVAGLAGAVYAIGGGPTPGLDVSGANEFLPLG